MKISVRAIVVSIFLICLAFPPGSFAITAFEEHFDDVTPPALPSGWTSVSLIGAQSAVTSPLQSHSSPRSALLPNPSTRSDTALVTKSVSFSTGTPTHRLKVSFYHKRGMENNFDAGVLEVSINGGGFVDVTSPSIGGSFTSNGYNWPSVASAFTNPLAGRPAWTGVAASFENVVLVIPSMPSDTPYQFRFRLGSDTSISAAGWFIDDLKLDPELQTSIEIVPSASQVKAGGTATYLVRHFNPTSVEIPSAYFYLTSPSGDFIESVTLSSGFAQRISDFLMVVQTISPIPAFGSSEFSVTVKTSTPPKAGARMVIDQALDPRFVGASSALGFLSSSPALPSSELRNVPVFYYPASLCSAPPGPVPAELPGSLVVSPDAGGCSLGQSALTAQEAGAVAYARFAPPPPPSPTPYASPYVVEPATPGLTIPSFTAEAYTISLISGVLLGAAPGTTHVSLFGENSPLRSTSTIAVVNASAEESILSDNIVSSSVEVYIDQDSDGAADDTESCALDPNKQSPGACGCGVADTDANANGVADCLSNQDFKADLNLLKKLISQLKVDKFAAQKALRNRVKSLGAAVTARSAAPGISVSSPKFNLSKLGKALKKPLRALVAGSSGFATNKSATLKSVKALLKATA